ncbi:uncharacterized protein PHALS_00307 [Plasmopara halstedii]|uniref:Uncharacterized protein n=1 Tax=Plasmopara halstedii TaxID=4781 RepID=A0A0P1A716_PLAHL|nr:uncharacterized protein PHALS_00307 [Plasmopara halstedii]CEG35985.1 hypothetical protein PHALS_00307 [Plasmopara halstedii]|eukprot:XP_024572354.1 hypothetical protein PHALS_00307 [Plasmopara halstedii]
MSDDDKAKELPLRPSYTDADFATEKDDWKPCKNQSSLALSTTRRGTTQRKWVHKSYLWDVKINFIQDYTKKGVVLSEYVASAEMLVDEVTKSLPAPQMKVLREKIGLVDIE